MRKALVRLAFAILRRQKATMWWDTVDVPGLFDPGMSGRVTFEFAKMRFFPPYAAQRQSAKDIGGWNFVHTCPPDCDE